MLLLAATMLSATMFGQTRDIYNFNMVLKVPRIYDNYQSMGYRKLQPQRLSGELHFIYKSNGKTTVEVKNLKNKTHKINGVPITYICYKYPYQGHEPTMVAIGSNKTGVFKSGGVEFAFQADPSYNIGFLDEDNTLMLELSGYGNIRNNTLKNLRGAVKGQIGCGCMAYGHVSPTRLWFGRLTDIVKDVAPLYGSFTATYKGSKVEPDDPDDDE